MISKNNIKALSAFVVGLIIMIYSADVILAVKNALIVCYNSVIPSLYIFMVISNYIAGSGSGLLCLPFLWYAKLMKIKDKKYSLYLLLSLMGGFAVGATLLNNLIKDNYPDNSIKAICPTMINNSVSFCVMAVGAGMLKKPVLGFLLYISLTTASLVTGFILSFTFKYNIVLQTKKHNNQNTGIVNSINNSVQSIISICGFVVVFYCLCEVLQLYTDNKVITTLVCCFTEVTCGCMEITEICGRNPTFICFCLSIIPISTLCQVFYFTNSAEIIKTLIISRFIHTPVSLLIFSVLINIFPRANMAVAQRTLSVKMFYNTMEISSVLFMVTFAFLAICDNNKLFTKTRR